MTRFRHLFPTSTPTPERYTYPREVRGAEFRTPPRDDRPGHGNRLIQEVKAAEQQARTVSAQQPPEQQPKGVVLEFFSDPGFKLQLQSLDVRQSGIELCNSRIENDVMHATVFVPEGKVAIFVRRLEAYVAQRAGSRDYRTLAESVTAVRLAALESFWTDAGAFPQERDIGMHWEVWLRELSDGRDTSAEFRAAAQAAAIEVSDLEIRFPERRVLLARAAVNQLTQVANLFDLLAELRLAKRLTGEFVEMLPRDQAALIAEAVGRIQAPPLDAPAVCHLDTGVNRGHPLIEIALAQSDLLACDPNWSAADTDPQQHGTGMAGIALYGCLTELFSNSDPVRLRHRLESVKILARETANDPDLYGEITNQAVSRIEIVAPNRPRAVCLTVTADGRDEGLPSSWSAALDQTCIGNEDGSRRLVFVSAGNTPADDRHNYPDHNHLHGIEDPAQAFNVVTVGATTERSVIHLPGYEGWRPIAEPGSLSPSSRTSIVWQDKSWPLKPDIVMEGGNLAIDPATGHADYVDDLMLLTTRLAPSGAMLTSTADTSASAALAARYAAIVFGQYPDLWPETIRGLLVHSARWTDSMLREFPYADRHNRLRCYGFGVPDLERAMWSAESSATLVVEGTLQPFDKLDGTVKTKDMHLHRLPWPSEVLQGLGEVEIRMRVTLSYFIEPNPGRRGWTRKHRYQSHGLRFEVKRPEETNSQFHRRISGAGGDDDGGAATTVSEDRDWELGQQLRCKGSIHSDTWTGTAAQLAECGVIAVFPVTGWWKERPHLERWNRLARYSLLVTLETQRTNVDLYTPIATQIGVPVAAVVEI